ncbi:predicted protein [Sclerotinia sclerotiorum 1980 UF-70]|uniref:Uncharacterized protein n=1 Tax=Sclerotinia sclerotiorum (strain ATCC 18683 / 1980 / Ss-1) TaxID=665079 RepID=A7EF96_SCLS1|nr:predicted protein [Sclerotinia sclerotiorum 1980 UF-70]EDO01512.1 predicted protein [Sclerotinia sclerotiorum 1980 UF-70]
MPQSGNQLDQLLLIVSKSSFNIDLLPEFLWFLIGYFKRTLLEGTFVLHWISWILRVCGPTIRMDLRFVWTYDSYGSTIRIDLRFVWTYDSYGPTIRIPEYAGSIT